MEDITQPSTMPLFKKIDRALFERIDKFKLTPNYNNIQDLYNSLEEEQQKVAKAVLILALFIIPSMFLSLLWWQNNSLKADLDMRTSIVTKAQQIIGQNEGLRNVGPQILSMNPIDSESMMTSRLSNMVSSIGMDLSKIQVSNFSNTTISANILKAEADFAFNGLSTDELMNLFTNLIQREKFRIQSVNITRNNESNLLQGQFKAIHFSSVVPTEEE